MIRHVRQGGFLMIVALIMIVVLVFMAIALGAMLGSSTLASGNHVGSVQALFQAESGLEFEQRRWAQNLEWYRSTSDPNPSAAGPQTLGSGTFTVSSNLPATMLDRGISAGAGTINVYTTGRFPISGILQIGDDLAAGAELVRYTGVSGTAFTGVSRAGGQGTVTSAASVHSRADRVYPVTILRTNLPANCIALASLQVDANSKFLSAGTLDIEGEEIAYASSSTIAGTTTLSGITRCLDTITVVTPASHLINQPVTPVLVGGDSADYQVEMFSTGVQGTNIRYARRTIQR
ncbi:MAG: hypothetical protein H7232_10190 [Aeromicrobium sp.]|nr:hypothetical protein [Burkholderiales bacterium]